MPLTISSAVNESKRIRGAAWPFQQSYETPLDDLPRFVEAILAGMHDIRGAAVHIESLVFESEFVDELVASHGKTDVVTEGSSLIVTEPGEVAPLLHAFLQGYIDFFFVPVPAPFIVFADHDEWTTLLSTSEQGLEAGRASMRRAGFPPFANRLRPPPS